MKRFLLLLFIGCWHMTFLAVLPAQGDSRLGSDSYLAKHTYTSQEGKVKITFPAPFEEKLPSSSSGKAHTTKVSSTLGEMNFFLSYTIHDAPIEAHYEMAKLSMSSFSESLKGDLISEDDWKYKKESGRMGEIKIPRSDIRVFYRSLLVGQIQYQLIVTMPATGEEKNVKAFFKSFKLL